jgi:hypothetical protein
MRGGAALVAEIIRDIKDDVKDDVDKVHLEKVADVLEAAGSDTKREKAGEAMFITAMRKIKLSSAKELSSVDKRVDKIMNGHVRDILPAFDKLTKESADTFEKKMAGMNKMKVALERINQSNSKAMVALQERMESEPEKMKHELVENKEIRNKIVDAISGINGGDKIKDAFQNMAGGGVFGVIGGFFSWLWETFKFLVSAIVSALYFLMSLLATMSLVIIAFGGSGLIIAAIWVFLKQSHS